MIRSTSHMRSIPSTLTRLLQKSTQLLAYLFNVAIVIAASMEVAGVFNQLYLMNIGSAIQSGLFVLILLEMFYVVRSFIKYGSVNISLIISVGIVAIVKQMIFNMENPSLDTGLALSAMFLSLSIGLLIENHHYAMKIKQGRKPQRLSNTWQDFLDSKRQPSQEEHVLGNEKMVTQEPFLGSR